MMTRPSRILAAALFSTFILLATRRNPGQTPETRLVRIAQLQIDATQLEPYKAALKEEIEASLRLEPGVLTLYAVSVKNHPDQIRLFEIYASPATYQSHLQTPHFRKYKATTQTMVKSLTLIETDPILLGAK